MQRRPPVRHASTLKDRQSPKWASCPQTRVHPQLSNNPRQFGGTATRTRVSDDTEVVAKIFAVLVAALSVPLLGPFPMAHADIYCELGNLLIPQEVHQVGTYRDATCSAVAGLVATSDAGNCVRAVANYVVSRGYDPYVGKDIALHNC